MVFHHFEVLLRENGEPWVLGSGAGGTTFKARDIRLQRWVALKVVAARHFKSESAKELFLAEAQTAASLHHTSLAAIHYFGEQEGDCFYAMEYVDGSTLEELVSSEGAIAPEAALDIASQVAAALGVAHEAGLIHRDVKPANILLAHSPDEKRRAKLIDFGLAATAGAGETTGFAGTPLFASPEQLDEAEVDARSDVYSLGATLFYMLCGRPPFVGSLSQVVTQHTLQPTPVDLISSAPPEVIALVKRLMKKDPARRPRSGSQARLEIDAVRRGLSTDQQATALQWLGRKFGALRKLGSVEGGMLYSAAGNEGREFAVLHLDHSADGLAVADRYRFACPPLQQLKSAVIRRPDSLVEVADGLLVVDAVTEPSTRLLSVMRVRRLLPPEEALAILAPLAEALDEAAEHGLGIPNLGLRDIELRPPQDPKTRLLLWPDLVPRVDLLPVAEATRIDTSTTIVGRALVTSCRSSADEGFAPAFVIASLAYEMLGGMTAPTAGHYVPLPELNEEQNSLLRATLGGSSSVSNATDVVEGIFAGIPAPEVRFMGERGNSCLVETAAEPPVLSPSVPDNTPVGPNSFARFAYAGLALMALVLAAIYFLRPSNAPTSAGASVAATSVQEQSGVPPTDGSHSGASASSGLASPKAPEPVPVPSPQPEVLLPEPPPNTGSPRVASSENLPIRETEEETAALPAQAARHYPKILSFDEALASANAGDAYSQAVVSLYLGFGYKTAKNELRSKEYAMESAKQRNPLGIFRLGEMRRDGVSMTPNQKQASELFKKALPSLTALEDDPYALAAVGRILELDGDLLGARNYYVMSAHAGYGPAQLKCAELFAEEDPDAEERYRAMAAEQGLFR
jgi:TPR repeat protein